MRGLAFWASWGGGEERLLRRTKRNGRERGDRENRLHPPISPHDPPHTLGNIAASVHIGVQGCFPTHRGGLAAARPPVGWQHTWSSQLWCGGLCKSPGMHGGSFRGQFPELSGKSWTFSVKRCPKNKNSVPSPNSPPNDASILEEVATRQFAFQGCFSSKLTPPLRGV